MRKVGTMNKLAVGSGIALVAVAVAAATTLYACSGSEEPELRDAEAAAKLKPEDGSLYGDFLVAGSMVLALDVGDDEARLTGFDIDSGAEKWVVTEKELDFAWVGSDFVAIQPDAETIEILELDTGEVRHEIELKPMERSSGERLVGIAAGVVLVVDPEDDGDEMVTGLDPETGDELWTHLPSSGRSIAEVQPLGVEFGGDVTSGLGSSGRLKLASDAALFTYSTGTRPHEAIAVDIEHGWEQWKLDFGKGHRYPWLEWSADGVVSSVHWASESSDERTLTTVMADIGAPNEMKVQLAAYDAKKRKWEAAGDGHPGCGCRTVSPSCRTSTTVRT